jgi:polynucleotide 5'-hydroxyl-kinase GRC3/NOL9
VKRTVKKGKTLIVDGPASISLVAGKVEVLGAAVRTGEKVVVREGKRVPFEASKKAVFDLILGEGASFEEVDESTIPSSWKKALTEITSCGKPSVVMVIGGVDSGKTSFCTYLINQALEKKWKAAVIDADLGQSDVGPPSTIGFSHVKTPIKDLFEINAENAYFVGLTSPGKAIDRVVDGLVTSKEKALDAGVDFVVINTDGWIADEDAARYKVLLTEKVTPNIAVGIQADNELAPILTALKKTKVLAIGSPLAIQKRNREKRKILRELSYKKYLKKAKVQSFLMNWIRVERILLGVGASPTAEHMKQIEECLGTSPIHCEETPTSIFIVLRKEQWIDEDQMTKIEESLGRKAVVITEGNEEGLLVGLQDHLGSFLGIGVLLEVDYRRQVMKVYTPVSENVSTICVGQIKLDKKGREIGLSSIFAD